MPNELTNFQRDLQDPTSGLSSSLYESLSPVIGEKINKDKALREQLRKGLVGLEYLTGAKKNKVNTFFDEHPVEATTTDILGKSPLLGALLAAGGTGLNLRNQASNFAKVMPAEMARSGNPKVDATHPENLLKSDREDIARLLGKRESRERMDLLDRLSKSPTGLKSEYDILQGLDPSNPASPEASKLKAVTDEYKDFLDRSINPGKDELQRHAARKDLAQKEFEQAVNKHKEKFKDLLNKSDIAAEGTNLKEHVNFHESLNRAKQKGGLKKSLGEGLHSMLGNSAASQFLKKNILPQEGQAIADLLERHNLNAANPADIPLIRKIIEENLGPSAVTPGMEETLKTLFDPSKQKSKVLNFLRKNRFPLYAGGALAAGGTGLYHLLKAIQNQRYPEEQRKEWQKNSLKAQGKFREAEKI